MTAARTALLGALAAAAAGCAPYLEAESPAPPGRSARLDPVTGFWGVKSYRVELSQGAALALSCQRGESCEHMSVTSDDPTIALVRIASLSLLRPDRFGGGATTTAELVIVGRTPGVTRLHVHAEQGDRDVVVTIIPQPARPPA